MAITALFRTVYTDRFSLQKKAFAEHLGAVLLKMQSFKNVFKWRTVLLSHVWSPKCCGHIANVQMQLLPCEAGRKEQPSLASSCKGDALWALKAKCVRELGRKMSKVAVCLPVIKQSPLISSK